MTDFDLFGHGLDPSGSKFCAKSDSTGINKVWFGGPGGPTEHAKKDSIGVKTEVKITTSILTSILDSSGFKIGQKLIPLAST